MTGDSVVKTLVILFFIAVSPFVVAALFLLCWLGLAVTIGG